MIYIDRLYGKTIIKEPVVLDIIRSKAFQRLKGIDQAGYFEVHLPGTKHTRFEHSMGVYILLHINGASLKEQIAGLLHDISHSAFSHCIDYVFGEDKQKTHQHQDFMFRDFLQKTDIPKILKRYNIPISYIVNENNFPLKEKELPDLCADRIDYSLRTALIYGVISKSKLNYFLGHLKTIQTNWAFDTFIAAQQFAELFRHLNHEYYSGLPSITMFYTVGQYLKYALSKKYTTWKELYTTDQQVIRSINAHLPNDAHLQLLWKRMNNKSKVITDRKHYEAQVFCKSRLVDPLWIHGHMLNRVSNKNPKWKTIVKIESKPKEYFLRFED